MEACALKTLQILEREYRESEFLKLSRLIMVWVGMPVILFWSIMDYQEWGFQPLWMAIRGTFPIVTVGLAKLAQLKSLRGPYRHQIPFVLYTAYILLFCSLFISQSGYSHSRYFVGLPQILLSMSFLPFGAAEFLLISIVYFTFPVLVASKLLNDLTIFSSVQFQLYVTYSMFALLTYFVIDLIRRDSFKNKALLSLERESQKILIENQAREIAGNRVAVAIASAVQMLAHDVRKPFSILRIALEMLRSVTDITKLKTVLSRATPEVEKALGAVDGLIADVMEIGSSSTELITETVSPESLIESSLGEVLRIYPRANIRISYDLRHSRMVAVNPLKVGRVLSNIFANAIQAMNLEGEIWFKTRQVPGQHGSMVQFCIGNGDSFIPHENMPNLFEAFFTSGKKSGTGLGLAIAQKVIVTHGGRIWCESSKSPQYPAGKVEFFFTLPVAEAHVSRTTAHLPHHSSVITDQLDAIFTRDLIKDHAVNEAQLELSDKGVPTLEAEISESCQRTTRLFKILIVDDETVYRSALSSYLLRTPDLKRCFEVFHADSSTHALATVSSAPKDFDLIITDVDLGTNSASGFELVAALRQRGVTAMICVHSNRIVAADHRRALEAGANVFMPKPMARAQLLRLVLQSLERIGSTPPLVGYGQYN